MGFSPSNLTFEYTGGTTTVTYTDTSGLNIKKWDIRVNNNNNFNVEITSTSTTECTFVVTANENKFATQIEDVIYILYIYDGTSAQRRTTFTVSVKPNPELVKIKPVYSDVYFTYENDSNVIDYEILDGDNVIYSGKAYAEPNNNVINFNINRICSNYLNSSLDNFNEGIQYNFHYVKPFSIFVKNMYGNFENLGTYTFANSYDYDNDITSPSLNKPIKSTRGVFTYYENQIQCDVITIDRRQLGIATNINNGIVAVDVVTVEDNEIIRLNQLYRDGTVGLKEAISIFSNVDGDYVLVGNVGDFTTLIDGYDGMSNNFTLFKIVDTCYDYCLYYINAVGGIDSLLIKGNSKKVDNINSHYFNKSFNNTTTEFEKKKYINVITPSYTLYTDWFTDEEQSRLYHLLESTEVYLHNLNTGKIEPVNITNTQCEYKTFTNNGKKKFYNTINVEVAQEKLRR